MPEDYYSGCIVVVTGAGGGIGRALAVALARRGASLALVDQDAESVAETAQLCETQLCETQLGRRVGAQVRADALDVADRDAVAAHTRLVVEEFTRVDMVFAVAGVIHTGSVADSDFGAIDRVIDVNLWGVINIVKLFLPHVIASPRGHLVTVSSVFGLMAAPYYSAYNASKFAVRGFTESLHQEMKADGHSVQVTGVYPGGVRTSIVRHGTFASPEDAAKVIEQFETRVARTSPEDAATMILNGVERGRAHILVGIDAKLASMLLRVVGGAYQELLPWTRAFHARLTPIRSTSRVPRKRGFTPWARSGSEKRSGSRLTESRDTNTTSP